MTNIKPLLKWVGGKTQLINHIINRLPPININSYHEPFLGGGSVLLAILNKINTGDIIIIGSINAYDNNKALIAFYNNVKYNPNELFDIISQYIEQYNNCPDIIREKGRKHVPNPHNLQDALLSKEAYYYWSRKQYNSFDKQSINASALLLFLNKTCFRGLYRTNYKTGEFNVPYGNYKNPTIIDKDHLINFHNAIQSVNFIHSDFEDALVNIAEHDFVYLDPPYVPIKATSFVGYTDDGFPLEKHQKLFNIVKNMTNPIIMSNSSTKLVIDNFSELVIEYVNVRRSINSTNPADTCKEVIIRNYHI